jgi:hypothetical protein
MRDSRVWRFVTRTSKEAAECSRERRERDGHLKRFEQQDVVLEVDGHLVAECHLNHGHQLALDGQGQIAAADDALRVASLQLGQGADAQRGGFVGFDLVGKMFAR